MTIKIEFPLTDKQAIACIAAAHQIGCEPWEIAMSAIHFREEVVPISMIELKKRKGL